MSRTPRVLPPPLPLVLLRHHQLDQEEEAMVGKLPPFPRCSNTTRRRSTCPRTSTRTRLATLRAPPTLPPRHGPPPRYRASSPSTASGQVAPRASPAASVAGGEPHPAPQSPKAPTAEEARPPREPPLPPWCWRSRSCPRRWAPDAARRSLRPTRWARLLTMTIMVEPNKSHDPLLCNSLFFLCFSSGRSASGCASGPCRAAPTMATLSAISAKAGYCKAPTVSWKGSRVSGRNVVSMATTRRGLVSLRSPRFRVYAAKAETVSKVMDIVKQQLALAADVGLTAESKFADLGADSLDTVEIVMALEEEFKITVEEDNAQNITTIQDAADLIDKLVDQKPPAA